MLEPLQPLQPRQYYLDVLGSGDILEDARRGRDIMKPFMLRRDFTRAYGFAILTQETREELVHFLGTKKVLDAGSGTGYISKALHDAGVDVTAADNDHGSYGFETHHKRDVNADATSLLPGDFEAVLLVWPCYSKPFGHEVISAMRAGQILVFQGEGHGGCTADDAFFEELESERWSPLSELSDKLNEGHIQFPGIHDTWSVYQRLA